jgi:predicted  nucleic acid-binding Zn-ribbon protein
MTDRTLPTEAVETDHRLERSASKATEALARHRWHWTLDESNPLRVSIRAYARDVGRGFSTIRTQVNGFVAWSQGERARPLAEVIERTAMSAEKEEIVDAVANANKVGFQRARQSYSPDVSRVRDAVEHAVVRKPDMTAEDRAAYAKRTADNLARSRASEEQRTADRRRQQTARFMLVDARLSHARRDLLDALENARLGGFGDGEIALLETAVSAIRAVTALLDSAISGASNVDWDAELAKIGAEG